MSSILDEIRRRPKPGDLADWWAGQPKTAWSHDLEAEEREYLDFFTSSEAPERYRLYSGKVDPNALTPEQKKKARERFGDTRIAFHKYANRANRRRIVIHYVMTHPATINVLMATYRLSRDVNPMAFILERANQITRGKELFTGNDVSRAEALVTLAVPIILGGAFAAARASIKPKSVPPTTRALTDPIYDLPKEGGGMMIGGRWFTEHALERMAARTPQVLAELNLRVIKRAERLGLTPGSNAYKTFIDEMIGRIDPRGIPPSVVEAEILRPGSTNVKVITAKRKTIVVSVIHRKKGK